MQCSHNWPYVRTYRYLSHPSHSFQLNGSRNRKLLVNYKYFKANLFKWNKRIVAQIQKMQVFNANGKEIHKHAAIITIMQKLGEKHQTAGRKNIEIFQMRNPF